MALVASRRSRRIFYKAFMKSPTWKMLRQRPMAIPRPVALRRPSGKRQTLPRRTPKLPTRNHPTARRMARRLGTIRRRANRNQPPNRGSVSSWASHSVESPARRTLSSYTQDLERGAAFEDLDLSSFSAKPKAKVFCVSQHRRLRLAVKRAIPA